MSTPIEEKVEHNLKIRSGLVKYVLRIDYTNNNNGSSKNIRPLSSLHRCRVSDGRGKPEPVRLLLSVELLTLQRMDTSGGPAAAGSHAALPTSGTTASLRALNNGCTLNGSSAPEISERMVQITRQKVGGLGLSIKGGSEHKLPILISRYWQLSYFYHHNPWLIYF